MNNALGPAQRFATLPLPDKREKAPPPYSGNLYNNLINGNNLSSHHIMGNTLNPVQQVVYYSPK